MLHSKSLSTIYYVRNYLGKLFDERIILIILIFKNFTVHYKRTILT